MKKLLICLPTKDEEKILKRNIEILLNFLNQRNWYFYWQIIITINGSSDKSIDIAKKLASENNKIEYLETLEAGKGGAIKHCFDQYTQADILMYMDVDLAVSLENLNDLVLPILKEDYDFVLASRALKESKIKRSYIRDFLSKLYNKLSKLFFKHEIKDLQCGFKAIKKEAYEKIRPQLKNNQWFFDTEWIIFSQFYGLKIKEIPVDWKDNRYEKRKSAIKTFSVAFQFIVNLIKLKLRMIKIKKY